MIGYVSCWMTDNSWHVLLVEVISGLEACLFLVKPNSEPGISCRNEDFHGNEHRKWLGKSVFCGGEIDKHTCFSVKINMMDLSMQIEGTKLIFIMNFSVFHFFKFASRMPEIAQILVSTFKIIQGGGGMHAPRPHRNVLSFFISNSRLWNCCKQAKHAYLHGKCCTDFHLDKRHLLTQLCFFSSCCYLWKFKKYFLPSSSLSEKNRRKTKFLSFSLSLSLWSFSDLLVHFLFYQ